MPQPIFSWVINHKPMIIKMLSHFIKMVLRFAPNQPIICIKTRDDLRHFIARNAPNRFMFYYQQHYRNLLISRQLAPFPWLTTPLPLWGGAGGEALFPLHYFIFNYQPRHPHNYFISQLRWYCAIIPMDEFRKINALMVQLGTSCSFDSPGLARNEPTPGKHSQGDSTP